MQPHGRWASFAVAILSTPGVAFVTYSTAATLLIGEKFLFSASTLPSPYPAVRWVLQWLEWCGFLSLPMTFVVLIVAFAASGRLSRTALVMCVLSMIGSAVFVLRAYVGIHVFGI